METLFLSQAGSVNISFELSIEWCYVARPNKFARRGAFQTAIQILNWHSQSPAIRRVRISLMRIDLLKATEGHWAGTRDRPCPEADMRRPIFTHPGERLSGSSDQDRPFPCLSYRVRP